MAGGIQVEPVLGSRSTDTLSWLGPPRVVDGAELPVGVPARSPAPHDTPRPTLSGPLRIIAGPREDWFAPGALDMLLDASYVVSDDSNRIGLRLTGPALDRVREGELPSEGIVLGAVQVPPNGQPVVLLADHPTTGGYPVIGVVHHEDVWRCAQLRPGESLRFVRG
jgi:allophanate hydrolase subunit 2